MSQSSTNHRRLALMGGSVGVATAAVITYLVVAGNPKDEPETREIVRPTESASLSKHDVEGGVVEPWEAKQPTAAELAELAKAEAEEKAEKAAEEIKAEAAVRLARRDDVANQMARPAGILGLQQGGAFASLTGTGDISSGFDDANIYGGLLGNDPKNPNGGFGYGTGFGPGRGGTGWGTIGQIGRGTGTGSGYGVGGGRGGMRGRSAAVPTISIGQPTVAATAGDGELDKAIIRRYIKRNLQKLQYCYEKELLAKSTLAGTVVTRFTITESGVVGTASASGVSPEVSNCMAGVIQGIEFPKPKGTGGVSVTYPFTVRPAGS